MKAKSLPPLIRQDSTPGRKWQQCLPLQTSNYSAMSVVLKSWNMKLPKSRLILAFVGASLSGSSPKPISYAKMDARL